MLAKEYGCESVAFPLISSGIFSYPKDQALKVAIDTISSFLLENEMTVYIVIFDRKAYQISGKLFADIAAYIDDRYRMKQFYETYKDDEFVTPLVTQISWTNHLLIMSGSKSDFVNIS